MPLGRNMRSFDLDYIDALMRAYPGASAEELANLTYRSASSIKRYMKGGYSELRANETRYESVSEKADGQLSLDLESSLKSQIEALERWVESISIRLRQLESETR